MKKQTFYRIAAALLAAAALTGTAALGWLARPDSALADALYLSPEATDGEIVVIGMDAAALELLGPMPWPRSVMAEAVEALNADPQRRPAVIGIDVLYAGESADPAADAALTAAVAAGGNVVLAGAAVFGSDLVTEDGGFYVDSMAPLAWDAPFAALADAAARVGHINAMADTDGVLRHALLRLDTPEGERVQSFAREIYEAYCAARGAAPNPPPATDANGFFYLPYVSAPGAYSDGYSVVDLLSGAVDPDYFADKIVLIGPYAAGMQDEYVTAIDRAAHMFGVEFQANQIEAYRRGFYPRAVGEAPQCALLFAVSALALLWLLDRKLRWALPAWLAACAAWLALCLLLYRAGWMLHPLWVPLAVTLLFIAAVALNYIRAQREKHRITSTFGRYVDPAILKELLVQGGAAEQLGGSMKHIAVLFVDIRGFTAMSEALDPPTVVEIINRYLTLTTDCIMRHQGTLDKFVGDCTMAFWNAPLPQTDPVYRACCAAMDMVEGSKALGEELMARFGRTVSFGVGVHFGPAVVGNIGAPKRMDYTAIGDTVNTASRLESNAPGGKVLISRAVADALGQRAEVTSLGSSIRLKGKSADFEILSLDQLMYDRRDDLL